jgi:hypothetical protein
MGAISIWDAKILIQDFYKSNYGVDPSELAERVLKSILEDVDSKSWADGYKAAEDDQNIYNK